MLSVYNIPILTVIFIFAIHHSSVIFRPFQKLTELAVCELAEICVRESLAKRFLKSF